MTWPLSGNEAAEFRNILSPTKCSKLTKQWAAWELRCKGFSFREIADQLGLKSASGARALIERLQKRILARLDVSVEHRVREELAKIEKIEVALQPRLAQGDPKAVDAWSKICNRRDRLAGLVKADQPKTTVTVNIPSVVELVREPLPAKAETPMLDHLLTRQEEEGDTS